MSEYGMRDDRAPKLNGKPVRLALIGDAGSEQIIATVPKGEALRMLLMAVEQMRIELIKEIINGPQRVVQADLELVKP